VRNLGSCFASPILLLLRNGATKYQTLISIIRQARMAMIAYLSFIKMGQMTIHKKSLPLLPPGIL
jgi:hypothetical protein